jgi:hypothetical protein
MGWQQYSELNAVNLLPFLLRGHDSHLATKLGSDLIFHAYGEFFVFA